MSGVGCDACGSEFDTTAEEQRHDCNKHHTCGHCAHQTYGIVEMEKHLKECTNVQVAKVIESEFDCGYCEHVDQKDFNIHKESSLDKPEVFQATGEYTKPPKYSHEDTINPSHYMSLDAYCSNNDCQQPIECIDVTRHMNFNLGNVVKYLWRADHKGNRQEQLKKAHWYLRDEIRKEEPEFNAND